MNEDGALRWLRHEWTSVDQWAQAPTRHSEPEPQVAVNGSRVGFSARDAKTDHGERAA